MPDFPFAAANHIRGHRADFLRVTPLTQEALDRAEAFTETDLPGLIIGLGSTPTGKLAFAQVAALHNFLTSFIAEQTAAMHRSFADRHRKILDRNERLARHQRSLETELDERAARANDPHISEPHAQASGHRKQPASLGARIRETRMSIKLKQSHLAVRLGMHKTTISQIESGRWIPADDRLTPIAEFLQLAPRELCELADADRAARKMKKRTLRRIPA